MIRHLLRSLRRHLAVRAFERWGTDPLPVDWQAAMEEALGRPLEVTERRLRGRPKGVMVMRPVELPAGYDPPSAAVAPRP